MNNNNIQCVNVIENLSNELFYEIFDYLDGFKVIETFSNLNNRFKNLLLFSSVRLKIKFSSNLPSILMEHYCKQIIMPYKHQLISMKLPPGSEVTSFMELVTFNSSFDCLQSLTIMSIEEKHLKPLLLQLPSIPCLYTLKISIIRFYDDRGVELYLPVFRLPALKYVKILANVLHACFDLPSFVSTENFSAIENLSVNNFALDALINMISHTPKLRRLTCEKLSPCFNILMQVTSKILPNLTHLTIKRCDEVFRNLKIFIQEISSQLQVLKITASIDKDYLDADQWESLIIKHLLYLRVFEFHFHDSLNANIAPESHYKRFNRFLSSFWIERQWFLELEIDLGFRCPIIIYSILPLKYKKTITYSEEDFPATINSSMEILPDVKLNFKTLIDFNNNDICMKNIKTMFTIVQITNLNIDCYCSKEVLINILLLLPKLNSLSILTFSSNESIDQFVMNNNKLTKIVIKDMRDFKQVDFLINLCPQMEIFQVKYCLDINIELFVQYILSKHIPHLRLLCLCNTFNNDKMVVKLEAMIEQEKYIIKRILDRIYLIKK